MIDILVRGEKDEAWPAVKENLEKTKKKKTTKNPAREQEKNPRGIGRRERSTERKKQMGPEPGASSERMFL